MNPTQAQIAFRMRKLRTTLTRFDVDNDGCISREDFKRMAKKINELSDASEEAAAFCLKAFSHVADTFGIGFTLESKIPKEEAVANMNEAMLKLSGDDERTMCDNFHNPIFDAVDLNGDGRISFGRI